MFTAYDVLTYRDPELKGKIEALKEKVERLRVERAEGDIKTDITKEEGLYYGLINLKEFVTETLTNPEFQDILNKIPYNKYQEEHVSILDKILNMLMKYVRALIDSMGIKVNKNSILSNTLIETFQLINNNEMKGTPIFKTNKYSNYTGRTEQNARYGDVTVIISQDEKSAGTVKTKKEAGEKGVSIKYNDKKTQDIADIIITKLNMTNKAEASINFAGNEIANFVPVYKEYIRDQAKLQSKVDEFAYEVLNKIVISPRLQTEIKDIRTGGQTGIDEAFSKAASRLFITNSIVAPKNWMFRNYLIGEDGTIIADKRADVKNNPVAFKSRFGVESQISSKIDNIIQHQDSPRIDEDKKYTTPSDNPIQENDTQEGEVFSVFNQERYNKGNDEQFSQGKRAKTKRTLVKGSILNRDNIIEHLEHFQVVNKYNNTYFITRDYRKIGNQLKIDWNLAYINKFNDRFAKGIPVLNVQNVRDNHYIVTIDDTLLEEANGKIKESRNQDGSQLSLPLFSISNQIMEEAEENVEFILPRNIKILKDALENERENIRDNIKPSTAPIDKARYMQREQEISKDIDRISSMSKDYLPVIEAVAKRQLAYARSVVYSPRYTDIDLKVASDLIDIWMITDSSKFMSEQEAITPESRYNKLYKELSGEAKVLSDAMLRKLRLYIQNIIKERTGREPTIEELSTLDVEGASVIYFLDPSKFKNRLISTIDSTLKLADRNARTNLRYILNEIDEMFKPFKKGKYKYIADNKYDLFLEKDESGRYTGALKHMYSSEWWEFINTQTKLKNLVTKLSEGTTPAEVVKAKLSKYYKDMRERSITIDLRKLGYREDADSVAPDTQYIKDIEEELGFSIDVIINQAKDEYYKYVQDKNVQIELIADDETIEDKEKAMSDWETRESPFTALRKIDNYKDVGLRDVKVTGYKYLIRIPRKKIDGKETGYYSKDFQTIMQDPILRDFYTKYVETMQVLKEMLPNYISEQLPYLFLANVQKSMLADLLKGGMKSVLGKLNNKFISSMTSDELSKLNAVEERMFVKRNTLTGEIEANVPILYTDTRGTTMEERVTDLEVLLSAFAEMANNYHYMSTIKDKVSLYMKTLRAAEIIEKKGTSKIINKFGFLTTKKTGGEATVGAVQYEVDNVLLSKPHREEGESTIKLFENTAIWDTPAKMRLAKSIENERDELENLLSDREISEDDYNKQMRVLEERYEALGGHNLNYLKIGRDILNYVQLLGMGANLTAGIANLMFGIVGNITHAGGHIDYTPKDMRRAFGIILKSLSRPNSKTYKILKSMNIIFGNIDTRYGKKEMDKQHKILNIDFYIIQDKTEYIVQGMSIIAGMLHQKVNTTQGEISLYDLYDNAGNIKYDILDDTQKKAWKDRLGPEESNEYSKFVNRITQVNKIIHGNYDTSSSMYIKKSILGSMIMIFRSWIPEGFASRFLSERFDEQLGRDIKGRYRTYGELGLTKSMGELYRLVFKLESDLQKEGNEVDLENMRKNLMEIKMFLALGTVLILLKGALESGEDDTISMPAKILANATYRAYSDILFYVNPITFWTILRDPIPILRPITQSLYAINGTYRYLTNPDYRGQHPLTKWSKVVPIISQVPKTMYLSESLLY